MCPSTNIIGIKDKLIMWADDSGIYFRIETVRRSVVERSGLELV